MTKTRRAESELEGPTFVDITNSRRQSKVIVQLGSKCVCYYHVP